MTIGTDRVRANFNPSGRADVTFIKEKTADLIDFCESLKPATYTPGSEIGRLSALAQTAYEEAYMWAVKAATTGE